MFGCFRELCRDTHGATALEYGLIAALVSVAGIVALNTLGDSLIAIYTALTTNMDTAAASVP